MTEAKLISALNEENLSHFSKTYVPSRLLLGPGPSNAHPEVLSALSLNPIGHLDEAYISLMSDVQQLLRYTWQCNNRLTLPMSGTGSAAMEASIANFIEEGEKIHLKVKAISDTTNEQIKKDDDWKLQYIDLAFLEALCYQ